MKINSTKDKFAEVQNEGHLNHMAGVSYEIQDPIKQLRIVASSCFFGEPMYYHEDVKREDSEIDVTASENIMYKHLDSVLGQALSIPNYHQYSASKLVEVAIDDALNFDPEKTLQEAVRLRNEEHIRTTPQVIMVRAANNAKVRGTGLISKYADKIIIRADELSVQLAYQMQIFGQPIPNALKKAWKKSLESFSEYDLAKYRMENRKFKTVDVVNLVHAKGDAIHRLVRGELKLSEDIQTWESLTSKEGSTKETWEKAINVMGHMSLLRNLRNFTEKGVEPKIFTSKLLNTAKNGKQLPFRYYSAYRQLENVPGIHPVVLDAVESCLDISIGELPQFKGKVMSLCDNSGSAQGTTTSSMGTVKVSHIANLTAVLTGKAAEEGYIGVFGDELKVMPVRKNSSVFDDLKKAEEFAQNIGQSTENGIWMFFDKAIKQKEHWDHIFVYSDMQAGHGGLYGTDPREYKDYIWNMSDRTYGGERYIDVAKLIKTYREKVNPNVHVYLVQVAGYRDTLVPEFYDKTYILGGWGDGLLKFAHEMSNANQPKPETQVTVKKRKI